MMISKNTFHIILDSNNIMDTYFYKQPFPKFVEHVLYNTNSMNKIKHIPIEFVPKTINDLVILTRQKYDFKPNFDYARHK